MDLLLFTLMKTEQEIIRELLGTHQIMLINRGKDGAPDAQGNPGGKGGVGIHKFDSCEDLKTFLEQAAKNKTWPYHT